MSTTEDLSSLLTNTKITDNQRIFIAEYVNNGFNGTQAYLKLNLTQNYDTARTDASKLLANSNVKAAIKDYLNEIISDYKDTLEYEIIQMYKLRAFYNTEDILDKEGNLKLEKTGKLDDLGKLTKCIDGIETTYNRLGKKITKVKLANRENALEKLSMYMKLLTQNIDFTSKGKRIGAVNFESLTEEEAEKAYHEIQSKITKKI
jgi:phage terminase small subunit